MISVVSTDVVYRNPKPYLKSIHAWHPSIVLTDEGDLIAGFDLGEAIESLDYRTYFARSADLGETWSAPMPLMQDPYEGPSTHSVRLGRLRNGELLGFGGRFHRDKAGEGLVNRANLGYVAMDLITIRSRDHGRTWDTPATVSPPLVGPSFETCHRVVELDDGRLLAPTATWRGWNSDEPNGMKAIALISYDKGATWPDWMTVIDQYERNVFSWEQGLTQLADGRLLAVAWSFDEASGKSLPNRFAISSDGKSFSEPRENGMLGETAKLLTLRDGRVLCLYRRLDQPGLWANLVEIKGDDWIIVSESPIWRGPKSGMSGVVASGDELSALKFGFPSMVQLSDNDVIVVYWRLDDGLHEIRQVRLYID